MTKLTANQTEKFFDNFLKANTQAGDNVTNAWWTIDDRLANKLEKMGFVEIVTAFDLHNSFKIDGQKYNAVLTPKAIEFARTEFGDFHTTKRQINIVANRCWKCNGTGYIREYGHVQGGVCFECNGNGKAK